MNTVRPSPLILGLPAMGVPAAFYARFADALAAATGALVEFADLPGQGDRPERARGGADFGYREIVEQELPAWVACRRAEHPGRPLVLLGHSLGGQLALVASATLAPQVDALVLIAAGTAHWRAWPAGRRWRAWAVVQAIRAVAALWPWYPGRALGFGGEQSRRLMRDWGYNATTGRYRLEGGRRGVAEIERALHAVTLPVLLLGVRDDPVAPAGARDELIAKLPCARVSRLVIDGVRNDGPWRRHFSWARVPDEAVQAVAGWLEGLPVRRHPGPAPVTPRRQREIERVAA